LRLRQNYTGFCDSVHPKIIVIKEIITLMSKGAYLHCVGIFRLSSKSSLSLTTCRKILELD
jgi:hypothetical protein